MNPNNSTPLDLLAAGYVNVPGCPTPIVVTQTTAPQVQQIMTPATGRTIDLGSLAQGTSNSTNFTFTNNTLATVTYWFSTLFMQPGDAAAFGIAGNSARDFPDALGDVGPGTFQTNGGDHLSDLNQMALSLRGLIVSRVTVTGTGSGSAQSTQELQINNQNLNGDQCASRILPGICDVCPTGNDGTTFSKTFNGPIGYGGLTSFGYPVLAGQTVQVRLHFMAQGIGQFEPLADTGGTCGVSY